RVVLAGPSKRTAPVVVAEGVVPRDDLAAQLLHHRPERLHPVLGPLDELVPRRTGVGRLHHECGHRGPPRRRFLEIYSRRARAATPAGNRLRYRELMVVATCSMAVKPRARRLAECALAALWLLLAATPGG